MSGLERALARKILVCVGSGGVGKTTVAAALGIQAAALGKRVLVCTIDPAQRLANAMGLDQLGNAELRVPEEKLAAAGLRPRGELYAMMLDLKRSWDEVVERYAPPARRQAILESRFYRQLSTALAGSQEYVAMEKLHALHHKGVYDLIVLDTPPTAHALDFLDAPNRVIDFLDNDLARFLASPARAAGRAGLKVFQVGGSYLLRVLARFTGAGTLEDLGSFLASLQGMYDGFKARAAQVKALLASDATAFVLVTSPAPLGVDEAITLHDRLAKDGVPVVAVVANRVNPDFTDGQPLDRPALAAAARALQVPPVPGLPPLAERLAQTLDEATVLAGLDRAQLDRLAKACAPTPLVAVPRFDVDVHDLAGLWEIDRHLFRDEAAAATNA